MQVELLLQASVAVQVRAMPALPVQLAGVGASVNPGVNTLTFNQLVTVNGALNYTAGAGMGAFGGGLLINNSGAFSNTGSASMAFSGSPCALASGAVDAAPT